jgi:hypothetical protein
LQTQPGKLNSCRELYWAAGFLEGEGTFYAMARNGSKGQPITAACRVSASQVHTDPLVRLLVNFGGRIDYVDNSRQKNQGFHGESPQNIYVWSCEGGRARGIAMTMYKLMSPKTQGRIYKMLKTGPATMDNRGHRS